MASIGNWSEGSVRCTMVTGVAVTGQIDHKERLSRAIEKGLVLREQGFALLIAAHSLLAPPVGWGPV